VVSARLDALIKLLLAHKNHNAERVVHRRAFSLLKSHAKIRDPKPQEKSGNHTQFVLVAIVDAVEARWVWIAICARGLGPGFAWL